MHNRTRKLARLSLTGMLALGLVAVVWSIGTGAPSEAQGGAMHNCPHPGKWAIAVWDGADGTDADQAFATCGENAVIAAYDLDPQTQGWSRWFDARPELSNLQTLDEMQGVIALGGTGASARGSQGNFAYGDAVYPCPQPGKWAISVWSGQDGTGAVRALETCQVASVVAAYHIEPDAQSWQRYFRARGEMSNLKTFDNMQGVMALGGTTAVATPIVNQTTHGVIEWDEVWRDEIHIIGDILVEDRSTLTIEPGTKVLIAANQDVDNLVDDPFAMRQGIQNTIPDEGIGGVHFGEPYRDEGNHISILVVGTLQAVGTPEQMITITSDSATPGIYDWNSLDIYHGALSYSTVEYYRVLQIDGGVEVTHNILRHVGECAVCCGITPCSVLIEGNAISYAGHELLGTTGAPLIRGNHLRQQAGRTCFAGDGSPQIIGNTFEDCGHGIEFTDPPDAPVIEDNTFIDCGQDIGHNY